jgi:hypothetical protein
VGDLLTGDRDEGGAWFDAVRGAAAGIGPLDGWQAPASGDRVTVSIPGRQPLQVDESEEMRAFGLAMDSYEQPNRRTWMSFSKTTRSLTRGRWQPSGWAGS